MKRVFFFFHFLICLFLLVDLDISKLAYGFGLLKLPKMPELKGKDTSYFKSVDIDFNDIKYL